jgi:hypothetical protein
MFRRSNAPGLAACDLMHPRGDVATSSNQHGNSQHADGTAIVMKF